MKIKYIVDMHAGDHDDVPDAAEIIIDEKLFRRISQFRSAVKKLKAYTVTEFDYTPRLLARDWEKSDDSDPCYADWDGSFEAITMNVSDTDVHWHGYVKNTEISMETANISFDELRECFKVLRYRKNDLPLLIGALKSEKAQQLYEERLRGI